MGALLDCTSDASEREVDVAHHVGPIEKPLHMQSIKELQYSVRFESERDSEIFSKRRTLHSTHWRRR